MEKFEFTNLSKILGIYAQDIDALIRSMLHTMQKLLPDANKYSLKEVAEKVYTEHIKSLIDELSSSKERELMLVETLQEIESWIVCFPIASDEDMAQNFPRILEITTTALSGVKEKTKC